MQDGCVVAELPGGDVGELVVVTQRLAVLGLRLGAEVAAAGLATVQRVARFVTPDGQVATTYPANPNGSPGGLTAVTTPDARFPAMMPHPERVFRAVTNSWRPDEWQEDGGWMRMFRNARAFVG